MNRPIDLGRRDFLKAGAIEELLADVLASSRRLL